MLAIKLIILSIIFLCVATEDNKEPLEKKVSLSDSNDKQFIQTESLQLAGPAQQIKLQFRTNIINEMKTEFENFKSENTQILRLLIAELASQKQSLNTMAASLDQLKNGTADDQKHVLIILNDNTKKIETLISILNPKSIFDKHLNCIANCIEDEELPKDCSEIPDKSEHGNGVYLLRAPATDDQAFGAYCEKYKNESWTIIQRRQDGSINFYRNWEAYKNGFGNLSGEYWLGLQRIHKLTSQRNYKLWIKMIDVDGDAFDYKCSKFSVANESESFKLTLDDSCKDKDKDKRLFFNNGQKFSTFDKDNDEDRDDWALGRKGAWWYSYRSPSNLNGEYKPFSDVNTFYTGLWWRRDKEVSLKYVHIAIHPY